MARVAAWLAAAGVLLGLAGHVRAQAPTEAPVAVESPVEAGAAEAPPPPSPDGSAADAQGEVEVEVVPASDAADTADTRAADRGPDDARPTAGDPIAVLLLPSGSVDPSVSDALTELLIAAVAERGAGSIVGKEEFQARLGQGDATTAECLESITCLGRIGVALGVREVIAGTIGHHGDTWAFALSRIDVRTGATEGRVFREVEGDLGALVRTLSESVDDLYVETIDPGRLVVRASVDGAEVTLDGVLLGTIEDGGPVRRDLVAPGRHEVVVSARGHQTYRRTIDVEAGTTFALEAELAEIPHHGLEVPIVTWVVGGIAFAALAGGIGLGVSSSAHPSDGANMREVQSFFRARENEAIAADVLFALAAAATAAAVVPLVIAATEDGAPSVSVAPLEGGVLVTARGVFF